jgi:hypothetical protein
MTYGIAGFYIIHPNDRQKEIFDHILGFWRTEVAIHYNPHRVDALSVINFTKTIDDTVKEIKNLEGSDPFIITTTAQKRDNQDSFIDIKAIINHAQRPVLLLFGTGNGLHESVHLLAHHVLVPIQVASGYNHLSVRSAVAIVLDRLLSIE